MGLADLDEFLQRKGAIEVIVEVGSGSSTFNDIEEAVLISSSTTSTRLKEGIDVDLITVSARPIENGTQKRYSLTEKGERVFDWIKEIGLSPLIRKIQRIHRERDQKIETLRDRISRDKSLKQQYSEPNPGWEDPDESQYDIPPKEIPSKEERRHNRLQADLIERTEDTDTEEDGV